MKPCVVIGLLGPMMDAGSGPDRWHRWRPTVELCRLDDLVVDRFELLHGEHDKLLAQVGDDIAAVSPETTLRAHPIAWADPWDFEEVFSSLYAFARDYPFDVEREDYLVHITTGTHVAQICLFLLTESRHLPGRLMQLVPPRRWGSGPGRHVLIDLDLSAYDQLASRFAAERQSAHDTLKRGIATRNRAFNRLIERIELVATASDAPLLLTGPTGAGKSQLAAQIYQLRHARRLLSGPFVPVNCATLRGDQAMAALFGHERGAFTGAQRARPGLLRSAHDGLLFLDEIGELGADEQAMLLRAIESGRFLPVGADREVQSRFQLIAGTNADLYAAVQAGRFREDLLARIDLWSFQLPGLAERPEDIEPNLDYALAEQSRRLGRRVTFNREARARFVAFATGPEARWPRNFRDFNGAVERMVTLAPAGRIGVEQVDEEVARLTAIWARHSPREDAAVLLEPLLGAQGYAQLDRFERVQLADVVAVCAGSSSLSVAGRALFAASRARKKSHNDADRLRKYLARHGLQFETLRAELRAGSS